MILEQHSNQGDKAPQVAIVVNRIKAMIVAGDLAPGGRLPVEKDLAPLLGVSRSALREGISALAIMGIVESRQGSGTYVTSLDAALLRAPVGFMVDLQRSSGPADVHAVRRVLETEAAGLAARRFTAEHAAEGAALLSEAEEALASLDPDSQRAALDADMRFHALIARIAGNSVLEALIDALAGRTQRARLWRHFAIEGIGEIGLDQHRQLLDALTARDSERARAVMAYHLFNVEETVAHADDATP